MRDLLNILKSFSILNEASRGLLFRAKGDRFFKGNRANPESALIFDRAEYYPQQPGNYDTHEEMMDAYHEIEQTYKGIKAVNKPTSANKSFAVIILTDEKTRKPVYFARFFNSIRPDMAGAWPNTDLKTTAGYQLEKETSLKASYGLKPSDLFAPPATFSNVNQLLTAFKKSEAAQPFVPGFEMMYLNPPQFPVFEGANEFYTAIRDDLGEIIGPVALIQGLDCGTGAKAADRHLLKGSGYNGSGVRFPTGKTNGLVDSYVLTAQGVEIGISSKGEKGATASIKNVSDGINQVRTKGSDEQKQLLIKYKTEVNLIEKIGKETAIDFPLNFMIEHGQLSEPAKAAIKSLIQVGAKTLDDVEMDEKTYLEINNLLGYKGAKTQLPNYNVGYHAMSSIADIVANQINGNPKFGKACLDFLNSSPIIQLHMSVSKQKDSDVKVTGFTSKYPPNFQGTVALDTSKTYSATGISGRMNFAYNGVDAGVGDERQTPDTPAADTGLAQAAKQITRESQVGRKKRLHLR